MHPLPHKAISAGPPGAGGQSFCLPVVILSTPLTGYPILLLVKYHIEYTSACRLPFWLFFLSGVVLWSFLLSGVLVACLSFWAS